AGFVRRPMANDLVPDCPGKNGEHHKKQPRPDVNGLTTAPFETCPAGISPVILPSVGIRC
ncbi:MAG: hypothetical protein ACP5D1_12965, partial [Bacteroidales bacterium]